MKQTKQMQRIAAMEQALDRAQAAVDGLDRALDAYHDALPDIRALAGYLQSREWKKDFAADEAGVLPPELKRGVLSEDGIYDLLTSDDALRARLAALRLEDEAPSDGGETDKEEPK